jgi:hypothetical protein
MSEFMCKLCFPNGKEIGQIAGEHWLIHDIGKYHIIYNQGCDEMFTFSETPIEDPFPDDKEDFTEAEWVEVCNHVNNLRQMDKLKFCVQDAVRLFNDCTEAGYDSDFFGPCEYWVHEKCAILIKEYLKQEAE